jgi:hypothetical protein
MTRVWNANYGVYGARRVWLALNREGIPGSPLHGGAADARAGREGARRGKLRLTTVADPGLPAWLTWFNGAFPGSPGRRLGVPGQDVGDGGRA